MRRKTWNPKHQQERNRRGNILPTLEHTDYLQNKSFAHKWWTHNWTPLNLPTDILLPELKRRKLTRNWSYCCSKWKLALQWLHDPRGELGLLSKSILILNCKSSSKSYIAAGVFQQSGSCRRDKSTKMQDKRESNVATTRSNSWKPPKKIVCPSFVLQISMAGTSNSTSTHWTTYTKPSQMKHESQNWASNR